MSWCMKPETPETDHKNLAESSSKDLGFHQQLKTINQDRKMLELKRKKWEAKYVIYIEFLVSNNDP